MFNSEDCRTEVRWVRSVVHHGRISSIFTERHEQRFVIISSPSLALQRSTQPAIVDGVFKNRVYLFVLSSRCR